MRQHLIANPEQWENVTLEHYLEALQAVLTDWDGRFINRGQPVPEQLTWELLGEVILAASIYE